MRWVQVSGSVDQCSGIQDLGFGFRVSGFGSRVSGIGFLVSGFGFGASGSRFRVEPRPQSCLECILCAELARQRREMHDFIRKDF